MPASFFELDVNLGYTFGTCTFAKW